LPTDSPLFTSDSSFLTRRPEQLSIEEFVDLTNQVEKALCASTK